MESRLSTDYRSFDQTAPNPTDIAAAANCEGLYTLSVFFCGTAGRLKPPTTQIGVFAAGTVARDVTDERLCALLSHAHASLALSWR